jgi:hypothetical protein
MFKNTIRKFMRYLLIYVAIILFACTFYQTSLMAGGLEPLPDLQNAVEEVRSIYSDKGSTFLSDKEYLVQKNYYSIQSKIQKLKVLKEVKGHFEKAVNKAEEKFDSGEEDVSQSAITKLKLGLAGTLNDIIELESEVKLARLALGSIFKDNSFLDRELLVSNIKPVEFGFENYDAWLKESGLNSDINIEETQYTDNELGLKTGFIKAVENREKLNLSRSNRKISRALLVSEVANYDFGIGEAGDLFEALIIYTRVLSGYYDSVYNFNLAVADLNRVKTSWTGKP